MATATFDSAITTAFAAMFGASEGTATPSANAGTSTLSAFLVDVPPGCVADIVDVSASTTVSLSGATPPSVDATDGIAIVAIAWDGASPAPIDGTPSITSGDDLAALSPGFGMVGRWYTAAGGTVPGSVPTPVSATWTGAVAPGSSLVVVVSVDMGDAAAGTLTATAPTVDVTFAPGSACAGGGGGGGTYRPPVGRYPARADRPSSVVGDRSAFRRR